MENKKLVEGNLGLYLALGSILTTLFFPMITITSISSQEKIHLYFWHIMDNIGIALYLFATIILLLLIYLKEPKRDLKFLFTLEMLIQCSIFFYVLIKAGSFAEYDSVAKIGDVQPIIFLAVIFTYISRTKAESLHINYTVMNQQKSSQQNQTAKDKRKRVHNDSNSGLMSDKQILSILKEGKSKIVDNITLDNIINSLENEPDCPESYVARALIDNANKITHINMGLKKHPDNPLLLSVIKTNKGEAFENEREDILLYKALMQLLDHKNISDEIRTLTLELKNFLTTEPFSIVSYLGRMLLDGERIDRYIEFAIEKYPECSSFILIKEKMNNSSLTTKDIQNEIAFQLAEKEFHENLQSISDKKEFDSSFIKLVRRTIKNKPTSVVSFIQRLLVDTSYVELFIIFAPYYHPSNESIKSIIYKLENNELTYEYLGGELQKEMNKIDVKNKLDIVKDSFDKEKDSNIIKLAESMRDNLDADPAIGNLTRAILDPENAHHYMKEALNAGEDNPQVLLMTLMYFIQNKEFSEAIIVADKLMKLDIGPKALFYCANAYYGANDFIKSQNVIDQYLDLEDNEFIDFALLIKLISIANTGSVDDVISAIDSLPIVSEDIFEDLVDFYSEKLELDALNLIIDIALNYYPDNIRFNLLKINNISRHDIEKAIDQCYQLVIDNPKNALVHMTLANLAIKHEPKRDLGLMHGIFAYKLDANNEMVQSIRKAIPILDMMINDKELVASLDEELEQFLLGVQ